MRFGKQWLFFQVILSFCFFSFWLTSAYTPATRTPMNAVIALTDLLLQERDTLGEEQVEHLEVIQTSGHHLLTVSNTKVDVIFII